MHQASALGPLGQYLGLVICPSNQDVVGDSAEQPVVILLQHTCHHHDTKLMTLT